MIPELRYLSYEERVKECILTNFETRRSRGDQTEVFSRYWMGMIILIILLIFSHLIKITQLEDTT